MWKTTDGGATWKPTFDKESSQAIGALAVAPKRGVFRTEDGGRTWQHVLFVDQNTGCSGLHMAHKDPNLVIAGIREMYLQTHVLQSGGPGSGIHISRFSKLMKEIEAFNTAHAGRIAPITD